MSQSPNPLRMYVVRATALALMGATYGLSRLPELSATERQATGSGFSFQRTTLPELPGDHSRRLRPVHPSIRAHQGWISGLGAAVALNDLDEDGLPNDVCYTDTRTDQVIVAPAPGTGSRYAPFALDVKPLPYDAESTAPMGALPGDFNEDGRMDLAVYYWGRTPVLFLRQPGKALNTASFKPYDLLPGRDRWFTNAATQADLDGDGHLDLVFGNYFQDGGHILDAHGTGREEMQASMSRALNGGRKHVFLWDKAGTSPVRFREAQNAFDPATTRGWSLAMGAADLDGDLLPELYFSHDFGADRMLHNRSTPGALQFARLHGERALNTPASKVIDHDSFKGMGCDFADFNGDGVQDVYVSNLTGVHRLQESHFLWESTGKVDQMRQGIAPYRERSEDYGLSRSGWCWDSRLADFNNDGVLEASQAAGFLKGEVNRWPELHELSFANDNLLHRPEVWLRVQTPQDDLSGDDHNPFWVRARDGRYYDLAQEVGLGLPQVSRGLAIADVDGDGRLDMAFGNQWGPNAFYHNASTSRGGFLGLHLRLPLTTPPSPSVADHAGRIPPPANTRPAIGAEVLVRLPDGRKLAAQVDGGSGHSGKRSPDIHFGLGELAAGTRLPVQIRWRDASGAAQEQTVQLTAGWHTLVLGAQKEQQ